MRDDEASYTAFSVLQGVLYVASQPRFAGVVSPEVVDAARQILAASPAGQRRLRQLGQARSRWLGSMLERLLMPGITLHYVLRKRFIEDAVRSAVADGTTQIIVLGAGFDTLAWRLHAEAPDVTFIEIDHPATSQLKSDALLPGGDRENFHLQPADFSQQKLADVLRRCPAFDADRRTVFVCEGVLMYLVPDDVRRLLNSIVTVCGAGGTRLILTAVEPRNSPRNNSGPLLRPYLWWKNEPLKWTIASDEIGAFLAAEQFRVLEISSAESLRSRYLPDDFRGPVHTSEYVAVTQVDPMVTG